MYAKKEKIYPTYFSKHNSNRESHKREDKYFCNVYVPFDDTKILEFSQCQKSEKAPFIIHADLVCLIEKIDGSEIILKIQLQQK